MAVLRILLCLALAANVFGAAPKIDAAAEKILREATAEFRFAKTAEVDLRLNAKIKAPAQLLSTDFSLAIERPNKFALLRKQGDLGVSTICDGTNAFMFLKQPNVYSAQPAPMDISGLESDVSSPTGDTMGSMSFIAALFSPDPYKALMAGVTEAAVDPSEKEGKRINFKQEGLTWVLFVGADGKIRKIDVTIPEMELSIEFSNWKFNPALAPDRFMFTPPEGARKVPSVYQKEVEGEDSGLVGEPLPGVKLKTPEGGTFDTASLKGKVTVLVVWAGEAKHSVDALRAGSELAKQKGAAFAAINVDPDPAKVTSILAKNKLAIKTAIDPKAEATEKLEIEGVPMTFLIDKAGTVQKAWLGFHETFATVIGHELDLMLGKTTR